MLDVLDPTYLAMYIRPLDLCGGDSQPQRTVQMYNGLLREM